MEHCNSIVDRLDFLNFNYGTDYLIAIISWLVEINQIKFVSQIPPLLGVWGTLGLHEATFSCTILEKDGKSIKKFLFVVGFVIPCVVIIISYSCIYWIVRKQREKLNKHNTVTRKSSGSCRVRDREDSRLTAMMLMIFICFLVCFLPLMLVNVTMKDDEHPWIQILSSILAWASSVINPFIYAASNRTYRVAYYKLLSSLKFWGQPLSPIASKTFIPSKCSREGSANNNSGSLNTTKEKVHVLDIKNGTSASVWKYIFGVSVPIFI